ncbi:MAG: response regulator [Pseudomonas sp.]
MPASNTISVLLIEDSPHDAELAQLALERSGYRLDVELVYDHYGVVEALQRREFDLILADFILPGFSGSQALEEAQRLAPKTPFIFLSGVYGEENAVNMMRAGAVDYVLKQNLSLLPKAVNRAMAEVNERRRRQQAEQALQEIGARARLAVEAAGLGMWDYEPATGHLRCDQRYRAMCGLDADEALDMSVFERLCHPEDLPVLRAAVEAVTHDPSHPDFATPYRISLPDGRERWLEMRGQAFFDQGRCTRFVGVVMDITEQRAATEALKQMNETLGERVQERTRERDRTWELSRDLLAVTSFDSTTLAVNPAWYSILGWPQDELLGLPLVALTHPDDVRSSRVAMATVRRGQVADRFVNRLRHRDGSYRWIAWSAVPDAGRAYVAGRDISNEIANIDKLADANSALRQQIQERENVEATLRQMQRLEAVGQLTAGVAHDFNNLLTVILTSATFLQRDLERGNVPAETSLRRVNHIRTAGERGATLTGQLLAFARRQQLAPTPLNLNQTLDDLHTLLKSTLGGRISVAVQAQADLWHALVDPTQIDMIILNLAINARDAMKDGGQLVLATANVSISQPAQSAEEPGPGDYVMLSVSDTGTGMSDEVLQKAFEPFFTTKEVGKGSGLGLAQVFGFAKQSGGGARIFTEVDVGTTVQVYLPRTEAQHDGDGDALAAADDELLRGEHRILLVDDDAGVRDVTAQMLQRLGFQVIEADSGARALQLLATLEVDLLLADFAMPGMNGGELARVVAVQQPQLPIVFISGYAELDSVGLGDSPVIQKPFSEEQLVRKLLHALRAAQPRPADQENPEHG